MDNGSNTLSLDAFIGQSTKVGTLWVKRDDVLTLHFEYDEKWMETGFPLSPHLPFGQQITSSTIKNYLENLFPEGRGFEMMLENTTISRHNIFALTEKVGHDTAGAIEFRPTGAQLTPTNYRVISDAELNSRVEQLVNFNRSIADWDGKTRLSVAGVQDKLNLLYMNGQYGVGDGSLSSNVIVKFETGKSPCIVVNEYFTTTLAKYADLQVPKVSIANFGNYRGLVVSRFDRKVVSNTEVVKRHIIDGCQMCNLPSAYKYERNFGDGVDVQQIRDGVSFRKLLDLDVKDKAIYQEFLLRWTIFNVLVNNYDAHGKNISFAVSKSGYSLMPFYDLVNIQALSDERHRRNENMSEYVPQIDPSLSFAMSFGDYEQGSIGIFNPPIGEYAWAMLSEEFEMSLPRMKNIMLQIAEAVEYGSNYTAKAMLAREDLSEQEKVHIPEWSGHRFRDYPDTHSDLIRTPFPE